MNPITKQPSLFFGKKVTLPAGTILNLKNTNDIDFNRARTGNSFPLEVSRPVYSSETGDLLVKTGKAPETPVTVEENESILEGAWQILKTITGYGRSMEFFPESKATLQFKQGHIKAIDGTPIPFTSKEKFKPFMVHNTFIMADPPIQLETLPAGVSIKAVTTKDVSIEVPDTPTAKSNK